MKKSKKALELCESGNIKYFWWERDFILTWQGCNVKFQHRFKSFHVVTHLQTFVQALLECKYFKMIPSLRSI